MDFWKNTFHAVCDVVVCEIKPTAKFKSWKYIINEVSLSQKKESTLNRSNELFGIWIYFREVKLII